jgi:sulfate/thiosulfate transport system ATP-binding protein
VLRRVLAVGPTARLELEREDGQGFVEAEISRDTLHSLGLAEGQRVAVRPRSLRIFGDAPRAA